MRRVAPLLAAVAAICGSRSATADEAATTPFAALDEEGEQVAKPPGATTGPDPGLFDTLGAAGRDRWEIRTDETFSTRRIATERLDLGAFWRRSPLYGFVFRVSQGMAQDTTSGLYSINGPLFAAGLRFQSISGHEWIEFGARLIPNWSSPHDTDPGALRLALDAIRTAGQSDDARWLPFDSLGVQAYFALTARLQLPEGLLPGTYYLGARYGGETSLAPMSVKTWLGSESGIIANAFVDLFVTIPQFVNCTANIELGAHGEASLSSIWPGDDALPLMAVGYLGWSPTTWLSARIFYGLSYLPLAKDTVNPYGVRLVFYLPP